MPHLSAKRKHYGEIITGALREAVIGLIFALMVAPLIFCITGRAHLTLDWSQRLYFLLDRPGGALGVQQESGSKPTFSVPKSWTFVDLNGGFCTQRGGMPRCPPTTGQTDHTLLAGLLKNVRAQNPRLVVLDVLVTKSADTAGDKALFDALSRPGAPVLLSWFPLDGRLDDTPLSAQNEGLLFEMSGTPASSVRYLPAIKSLDGPTTRFLLPFQDVVVSGRQARLPTIALGAAMVLASPPGEPFVHLDAVRRGIEPLKCNVVEPEGCEAYAKTQRIFSFPRRAPHNDEPYVGSQDDPFYRRIIPDAVDPLLGGLKAGALADAVVVIGNSDFGAGDQTWSALGDISGAELIINDIRQYLVSEPEPEPAFWPALFSWIHSELWFYLISALSIFCIEIAINILWPLKGIHDSAPGVSDLAVAAVRPSAQRLLLRAMCKLVLAVLISLLAYGVVISTLLPRLTDFVSPFFGSLVQALVEWLYQLKRGLDALIDWGFTRAGWQVSDPD